MAGGFFDRAQRHTSIQHWLLLEFSPRRVILGSRYGGVACLGSFQLSARCLARVSIVSRSCDAHCGSIKSAGEIMLSELIEASPGG